jgi:hypothetical protein
MHKYRRAKRASGVSMDSLATSAILCLINVYIYIHRACISGWCRIRDIGSRFTVLLRYTSGGQRQKKKGNVQRNGSSLGEIRLIFFQTYVQWDWNANVCH